MKVNEQQLASLAIQFFMRLDFKGSELQEVVMVRNWLQSKVEPQQPMVPPKANGEAEAEKKEMN